MDWIGFPSIPSVSACGSVQGRKAELRYQRHPVGKFTWRLEESPAQEHSIPSDQIIAIISVSQYLDDDYSLLYVEVVESMENKHAAERTHFRNIIITRPPDDLIADFTPSGRSCWQLKHDDAFAARIRARIDAGEPLVHVILSTKSGQGHADKIYNNLLKPLLLHNGCARHQVHRTTSTNSITELCNALILPAGKAGKSLMIIMLSGDGGIVDMVNGLLPPSLKGSEAKGRGALDTGFEPQYLGLVPVGTGNALAHSSKLTSDCTLGMSALMRGYPEPLPVFTVRFSPPAHPVNPPSDESPPTPPAEQASSVAEVHGAVVFSWALHAALVADSDTPAYRKLGAERFQIAAKENLFPEDGKSTHAYQGKLLLQRAGRSALEEVPRQAHSYILATLCSNLEEKFMISPASKPVDGKLRILHFGPHADDVNSMSGERIVGLMQQAYDGGKHVSDPAVGYEPIEKLRLELQEDDDPTVDNAHGGSRRWRRVCIDGKIFTCDPRTVIEVSAPEKGPSSVLQIVSGSFIE